MDPRKVKKLEKFRELAGDDPPDSMVPGGVGLSHGIFWTIAIGVDLVVLLIVGMLLAKHDMPTWLSFGGMMMIGALMPWVISMVLFGSGVYRTAWIGWNKSKLIVLDPGLFVPSAKQIITFDLSGISHRWKGRGTVVVENEDISMALHLDRPKQDRSILERALESAQTQE